MIKEKRFTVGIPESLGYRARIVSKVSNRTLTKQIEHWAKMGELAEENPSLPGSFLNNLLISIEEFSNYGSQELNPFCSFCKITSTFKRLYMELAEAERAKLLNQIYQPWDKGSLIKMQGVIYYQGIFIDNQDYYLAYTACKDYKLCLLSLYKRQGGFNNTDKSDYYSPKVITLLLNDKEKKL